MIGRRLLVRDCQALFPGRDGYTRCTSWRQRHTEGKSPFEFRHPGHFSQEPLAHVHRFHMRQERILRAGEATSKKDES